MRETISCFVEMFCGEKKATLVLKERVKTNFC